MMKKISFKRHFPLEKHWPEVSDALTVRGGLEKQQWNTYVKLPGH